MPWYVYIIWAIFGTIMLITFAAYLYFIIGPERFEKILDNFKSKDWRYDG